MKAELIQTDMPFPVIKRLSFDTLQVNLGYKCNLSCVHCHVNAGPNRTEMMTRETAEQVLQVLDNFSVTTLDLTGGAPELNPNFRYLVEQAGQRGVKVIDRCNLTILFEPGQQDLGRFLVDNAVSIVASLPCYLEENVSKQRGKGVFSQSIDALRKLNELGYGVSEGLELNLVYNPQGASLPPPQAGLEQDYKRVLESEYGVYFNQLFTLANVPVQRFRSVLDAHDNYDEYMHLLRENYSEANLDTVMCRSMLSVDWQGFLYDCDFNQMLGIPAAYDSSEGRLPAARGKLSLRDLLDKESIPGPIAVAEHCFACTAGQGSSCGGALNE